MLEMVSNVTLVEMFKHSRTGYHGYTDQIISTFWSLLLLYNWLPWLLHLKYFNILELVTMVTLIKTFQHSRTGYHDCSHYVV